MKFIIVSFTVMADAVLDFYSALRASDGEPPAAAAAA